jgi:signal transduction histidine kinase
VEVITLRAPAWSGAARWTPAPDVVLALVVATLMLIGSGISLHDDFRIAISEGGGQPWFPGIEGILLVLGGSFLLALRRLVPLTVFTLVLLASLLYQALGYHPAPLPLDVLIALYTLAVHRRALLAGAAAAVYVAALTEEALLGWTSLDDDQFFVTLVAVVSTVGIGYAVALTRARATLAEQHAVDLAQDQDARMHAAMKQEQARIARDVHDIVAHDVSVIVAQAAAARRVFDSQPETAAATLASVEGLGRDALDGVRRLVDLLRTQGDQEERSPQPTLARLPHLVEQVRRAGLPVVLEVTGTPQPLPATVELSAFRIVQEALTNSLKHAGATRTRVLVEYLPRELRLEVRDRGRDRTRVGAAPASAGYGLVSMQQRTALLGGTLEAGSYDDGFRVAARLPLEGGPT